ncbi:MAG: dethiobiotin synthase [Bacteroidales bacterium]|nr:dethiobiotin synthase [Bacteroidales bacterium]
MRKLFVTGIGTGIGKTICAAILTEKLKADYWKPIQAGDLEKTDAQTIKSLISNKETIIHKERFLLHNPVSPHLAAEIEGIEIHLSDFCLPATTNTLIIEGAGGLMVPINKHGNLMIELVKEFDAEVVLVSQHYLGSINHTLLSIDALFKHSIKTAGIVFNGNTHESTESYILNYSGLQCLGRIFPEEHLTKEIIKKYARGFNDLI